MAYFLLMFYLKKIFLAISVRPIISTSSGPIYSEFAGLIELWLLMNDLKLLFSIPQGTLPWQPIVWANIDLQSTPCSSRDIR